MFRPKSIIRKTIDLERVIENAENIYYFYLDSNWEFRFIGVNISQLAEKKKKDAIRLRWFLGTFALRGFRKINVTSHGTLPASRFACRSIPPAVSIFRTKQYVWYVVVFKWLIISLLRRLLETFVAFQDV